MSGEWMNRGFDEVLASVVKRLRERGESVAFAESCTGGLLASRVAALAGVSDVFIGAVVAYSNRVKIELLGVPEAVLRQVGAVSTTVAEHMALGARRGLHAQWAVSITGIAGPTGGTPTKPVGTVCVAVSGPGVDWSTTFDFAGRDRGEVQQASALAALRLLEAGLTDGLNEVERVFGPRRGL